MSDMHPDPQTKSIIEKVNPEEHADNSRMSLFQKINHYSGLIVNGIEVSIIVFCVAALAVLLIVNVIARIFFQSLYFADEISVFLVLIITFTGVSYGVRKARHIRMGAFLDAMGPLSVQLVVDGPMSSAAWKSFERAVRARRQGETTVLACKVYFWARVVHLLSYTMAIPWVRTLSFAVAWLCQVALILQLL